MSNSYFSIVLPTYNRASFLPKAIQSVLDQTLADFELIIVDDGSTDNTREVVSGFADPRVRYFKKENEERSIARNFGIHHALGRYINFLDADDYFYPHHLKTAHQHLIINGEPEVLHLGYELKKMDTIIRKYESFDATLNKRIPFANELSCNAIFVRSDITSQFRFIPEKEAVFSEDWYLWIRLAARFKFHYVNEITSVVCEHDERSLKNQNPARFEDSINLILAHLDSDNEVARYYGSGYMYFKSENLSLLALLYSEYSRDKHKAIYYLMQSVRVYPKLVLRKRFWAILRNIIWAFWK
jgi:glycosyltransferase involved in cell wall biosynthesis